MLSQTDHPTQSRRPLPSLDFGDRDLTDAFVDVRDGSHSSISGLGHPRGSTPISVLSSRRSTQSTALSIDSPESRRPNMSALLEFLDNDSINPFPATPSAHRKNHKNSNHKINPSRSPPRSSASSPQLPSSATTSRSVAPNLDSPSSNFSNTINDNTRFERPGLLPVSSTPFTHRQDITSDQFSEISSPLNKRRSSSAVQPRLQSLQFSNQLSPPPASTSSHVPDQSPSNLSDNPSPQSQRPDTRFPAETPARLTTFKTPSAADRLAAAVMEGAPDTHWTFLVEREPVVVDSPVGIRRSKVVEELLQPMRPSLSCPGKPLNHIDGLDSQHSTSPAGIRSKHVGFPDSVKDSDLPQSLINHTRRATCHVSDPSSSLPHSPAHLITGSQRTKSAGNSPSPNVIHPLPQRPSASILATYDLDPNCMNKPHAADQVEILDARIHQLLSHIRSDHLEKANLVSALAEARSEVAALRDEVRLLRIGVQKLGDDRSYQSANARLERLHQNPAFVNPDTNVTQLEPSFSRYRNESRAASLHENPPPSTEIGPTEQINLLSDQQSKRAPIGATPRSNELDNYLKKFNRLTKVNSSSKQDDLFGKSPGINKMTRLFSDTLKCSDTRIKDLAKQCIGDLALGLTFTRCVDQLMMSPSAAMCTGLNLSDEQQQTFSGSESKDVRFRADSEIFNSANLDRLFSRLVVWKQVVLSKH